MIPKIIHICWFGRGQYSDKIKKCIDSYSNSLPDYKLMVWNEDNFDVNQYQFAREAYQLKKYAFVSDVCRVHVLREYGGVYLDTDVEVLRSLDRFLCQGFFCGFESPLLICTAVLGSSAKHPILDEILTYYASKSFYRYPLLKFVLKKVNKTPNTIIFTKILRARGLKQTNETQVLEHDIHVYPTEYFSPIDYKTKISRKSEETYSIHYFSGTWKD